MPTPFDTHAFSEMVAARRGRRLYLLPKRVPSGPCGAWLAMPDADYLFFEESTSGLHRDHIILHELGHLLCEHKASDVMDADLLHELLPSLDVAVVCRLMGRTTYSAVEEQEAEMIATLVQQRAGRRATSASTTAAPEDVALVLGRLQATLGGEGNERR